MILFPAIDLIAGKVVRLQRGDRAHMDVYNEDPVAQAISFLVSDRALGVNGEVLRVCGQNIVGQ